MLNSSCKPLKFKTDVFYVGCHSKFVKLNSGHSCSLRLHDCHLPSYSSCLMDVFSFSCHFNCVNFSFLGTISLKLSAFSLPCHLLCSKIFLILTCSLKLDVLLFSCHYSCAKLRFAKKYRIDMNVFDIWWNSSSFDLNFGLTWSF